MVHRESVVGDDGSHRLLVLPCALVVLVLVLMVTACAAGDGDAGAGSSVDGGIGVDGDSGERAVLPKKSAEESGAAGTVEGGPAEPVVTEDGRMLQPEGHTGLWFESEPSDPLEKLVYRSQRFVGQPVTLEPLGDRALLPQWEDMPDPCHPEVLRRMEELGVEVIVDDDIGFGYVQCTARSDAVVGKRRAIIAFDWGIVADVQEYASGGDYVSTKFPNYGKIYGGSLAEALGCISVYGFREVSHPVVASVSEFSYVSGCDSSAKALQLSFNLMGGDIDVEI